MTVKEVYDYLLQSMTAEQALMKLLEGHVLQYHKLKFNQGKEIHPIILISMAAMDLGWDFLIEKDIENIEGLTVGTQAYFDRLAKMKDSAQ